LAVAENASALLLVRVTDAVFNDGSDESEVLP
jgi:hypothetical protein